MSDLAHRADVKVTVYFRKPNKKTILKGYISSYTTYPKQGSKDWNRGNDLADGDYSKETLNRVIRDMKAVFESHKK